MPEEQYYKKFNELMKKKVGEEKYNQMTRQELMNSADSLITLLGAVEKHINREDSKTHRQ